MANQSDEPTRKKFPGYGFDTFDGCVDAMSDEADIDDPETFCGWLDSEGKEALDDPAADEVLTDLSVEYVSAVDEPAQDSEWLIAKNATAPDGNDHRWRSETRLYVAKRQSDTAKMSDRDTPKKVAFAPVLVPKEADKQGDVIPRPTIETAAHEYLSEYRKVDSDHDLRDGKGTPVESWTLKSDTTFDIPGGGESRTYPKGTWVMGIKFADETWERITSGELSGLSIYGGARPVDVDSITAKCARTKMSDGTDTNGEPSKRDALDAVSSPTNVGKASSPDEVPEWFKAKVKRDEDPCWDDYVMVGMKPDPNGDGQVPNCVPEDEADEPNRMGAEDMDIVDVWNEHMKESKDAGDTGTDDGTVTKMIDEDGLTSMLATVRDMDSVGPTTTIEDFAQSALESGDIDEGEVRNLSVLLGDSGMEMEEDAYDDDDEDDDEMEMSAGDTAEKSAVDDRVDKLVEVVDNLRESMKGLQATVEDRGPRGDRMGDDDDSERLEAIKTTFGLNSDEEAKVAREAIQEQVEKSGGEDVEVGYDGITDDEDVDAEATGADGSAAANRRMKTDD